MDVEHTPPHRRSRRHRARHGWLAGLLAAAVGIATGALAAVPAGAATPASQATAQSINANIAGLLAVAASDPATAATNDGTQSNDPVLGSPSAGVLAGQNFLGAGALAETAQAGADGTAYACAGVVSPGGDIAVGPGGTTCTATGAGTGGVTLDLGQLPGVGGALSTIASVQLSADSIVAHAAGGPAPTGDAAITGLTVHVVIAGVLSLDVPVSIPAGPNQDVLTAVVDALVADGNPLLGGLITTLDDTIRPLLSLQANHQTAPVAGELQVSGLHLELPDVAGAVLDLATVTVGPNAGPPTPTATSLQPDHGPAAGGTAVTVNGAGFVGGGTSVTIGGNVVAPADVTVDSGGTSLTFSTPAHAPGAVQVMVTSAAGTSGPLTYTYDPVPPPVITAPTDGSTVATSAPPISGTGDDGYSVTVAEAGTTLCAGTVSGGTWTCTPGTPLADGSHTITATQTDPAGHSSAASVPVTFTVATSNDPGDDSGGGDSGTSGGSGPTGSPGGSDSGTSGGSGPTGSPGGSDSGTSGGSGPTGGNTTTPASSGGDSLADTGVDVLSSLLAGALLLAAGGILLLATRRRAA